MESVIVSDHGVMLAKTGERLVVRGPKPKLELFEGGPQLLLPLGLPLGLDNPRPELSVVTSSGEKRPPKTVRNLDRDSDPSTTPRSAPERVEITLFRVGHIVVASNGISISTDLRVKRMHAPYVK